MNPKIVVRGAGDLATGTIVRLWKSGFCVVTIECEKPSAIRRRVAFSEAVYDGQATVEGITCVYVDTVAQCQRAWEQGKIPLLVDAEGKSIGDLQPTVVVDAILAKRNLGTNRPMAPITIALGPGFIAGQQVDAVVETMRGHQLGRVIYQGSALPNTGIPGKIAGFDRERVIHAPCTGQFHLVSDQTGKLIEIGHIVSRGDIIGKVGNTPVYATINGVLRGLIRPGYPVTKGLKIADIDPRIEESENCDTISDKARAIAGGVLEAMLHLAHQRGIALL